MIRNDVIEKFIIRIQQANRAKNKEVILETSEANEIALELTKLLTNQYNLLESIKNLQEASNSPLDLSGGKFK